MIPRSIPTSRRWCIAASLLWWPRAAPAAPKGGAPRPRSQGDGIRYRYRRRLPLMCCNRPQPLRARPLPSSGASVAGQGWQSVQRGLALFGLVATAALTVIMTAAQLGGLSRLDLPLILGTLVTEDPDRARVAGFVIYLVVGQGFALGYTATFALLGIATWWLGALLGMLHVAVALSVLVPLLVGIHPRMASGRAGPGSTAVLEPPGLLGLNYGPQTRRWPSSPMSPTASRSACC